MSLTWNAYPVDGGIYCENYSNEMIEVYDMDANCRAVVMSGNNVTIDLPAGIYVVAGNTKSRKVVVK
jgi:hypothetical protein